MGNRGKPRGVPASAADNLLPTGAGRAGSAGGGRTRGDPRQ
ncbi:signal peptidase I, partial [Streptomyces sp. NPDC007000]